MTTGKAVGALVGVGAAGGALAFILTRKKKSTTLTVSSISLTVANNTITEGASDEFTATAYDSNKNPVSGVSLTLYDSTSGTNASMGTTNSKGEATLSPKFPNSGKYTFYAATSGQSVKSSSLTVTVNTKSTTPTLSTIKLTSGSTTTTVGGSVKFTATGYDQNGNIIGDQTIEILDTTDQKVIANGSSNSSGQISGTEKFTESGTYKIQASGSGVNSNTITVTVNVSQAISSISLTVSSNSATAGVNITFTATVKNENNHDMSGVALTLIEKASSKAFNFSELTGSAGVAQLTLALNTTGTFVFYAEPTNATKPQSNTVTVTISAIPSCNSEQYLEQIGSEEECVCYSANATNVQMEQPETPTLFMQTQMVVTSYAFYDVRDSAKVCWISPTSSGSCPTFPFGGSPSCTGTEQYVEIQGLVTDSNGNACGDQGVCQLYELSFWLDNYSKEFTVYSAGSNGKADSWKVKLTYSIYDSTYNQITDSSGNINGGIHPDKNGKFTVYIGVEISMVSVSGQTIGGKVTGPMETIVLGLNSGFSPNVTASGGSLATTFYVQNCAYEVLKG